MFSDNQDYLTFVDFIKRFIYLTLTKDRHLYGSVYNNNMDKI